MVLCGVKFMPIPSGDSRTALVVDLQLLNNNVLDIFGKRAPKL